MNTNHLQVLLILAALLMTVRLSASADDPLPLPVSGGVNDSQRPGFAVSENRAAKVANRATTIVSMTDNVFLASSVTINAGDTVTWTNLGTMQHSTTSDTFVWGSPTLNPGVSFSFTFNNPGSFPYHCVFHGSAGFGMIGTVTVNPPAPAITSATSATGTTGTSFTYTITATNSPATYSASGLPGGLTLNIFTGEIFGTPATAGTFNVTIGATNTGGTGSATLTLTVSNPSPPIISSSISETTTVGSTYSYTITATNNPISYGASGLPGGLSINTTTGVISGTPTTSGFSNVNINATNSGGTGSATLALTINNPPTPVITSASSDSAAVSVSYSYTITATNNPTGFNALGLPSGLSVDTATGTISGSPTLSGTFIITLSATNAGGSGAATLILTINTTIPPVITSTLSAMGVLGVGFTYNITATGTEPVTFTATPLPSGLVLSGAAITGTPTEAGTFAVMLGAANVAGSDGKTLVLTIADPASGGDSDGDGFPDQLEIATGSSSLDAASTPLGIPAGATGSELSISKIGIKLNFLKTGVDTISVSGTLPIPNGFAEPQSIIVDFGGVIDTFALNARGSAKNGNNTFKLMVKTKKGTVAAQDARFMAKFSKGDFSSNLANEELDGEADVRGAQKDIVVIILFNNTRFQTTRALSYTARKGKSGSAK